MILPLVSKRPDDGDDICNRRIVTRVSMNLPLRATCGDKAETGSQDLRALSF